MKSFMWEIGIYPLLALLVLFVMATISIIILTIDRVIGG